MIWKGLKIEFWDAGNGMCGHIHSTKEINFPIPNTISMSTVICMFTLNLFKIVKCV